MTRRRVAKRPAPRFVEAEITTGPFAGWWAKARADFPAKLVRGLESGSIDDVLAVLGQIIVEHNMPNSDGELAAELGDVDPYTGLLAIADELAAGLTRLPNR